MTAGDLRAAARAESQRRRALWVAVAAVLVAVPLAVTLARSPRVTASVTIYPGVVKGLPAPREPAYFRRMLTDPGLQTEMRRNVGADPSAYADAGFTPRGRSLDLTVSAERPADALRLVNALAPQVVNASARDLARTAKARIAPLRAQIRRGRRSGSRREARLRRLAALRRIVASPPKRVVTGPRATAVRLESWADKLVDAIPGKTFGRPSPVWAALAGLLVAAVGWALALVHVPPPREP